MPLVELRGQERGARGRFPPAYDVGRGTLSTRVLSYRPDAGEDGYFLLLASPEIKAADDEPQRKTVMFVDRPLGKHERQEDRAGPRRR